ncbi:hypothetical protein LV779_36095 [Streptomyces thinghirensis]|nr:hypothetical protein [Streptomyces thinghirensis]
MLTELRDQGTGAPASGGVSRPRGRGRGGGAGGERGVRCRRGRGRTAGSSRRRTASTASVSWVFQVMPVQLTVLVAQGVEGLEAGSDDAVGRSGSGVPSSRA